MNLRNRIVVAIFVLAAAFAGVAYFVAQRSSSPTHLTQSVTQPAKLRVAVGTWAGYGNVYVGIAKHYFGNLDVSATVMDDSNARHAAYSSKDVDIMMSTVDQFALEADQGLPGTILVVTDESWGSDGILSKSSIRSVGELRGKRVAYTPGLAGEYLLGRALEQARLRRSDISAVPLNDPDAGITAFLNGQVDAVVSWEPHLADVVAKKQGRLLLTSRDIPETIIDILVAKDAVTSNPEVLRQFLDGWLRAGDFMVSNPREANSIIAEGLHVKSEDVAGMLSGLKLADRARNKYFLSGSTPQQTRAAMLFDAAAAYWRTLDRIKNSPHDKVSEGVVRYFNR